MGGVLLLIGVAAVIIIALKVRSDKKKTEEFLKQKPENAGTQKNKKGAAKVLLIAVSVVCIIVSAVCIVEAVQIKKLNASLCWCLPFCFRMWN